MRPVSKGVLGFVAVLACLGHSTIHAESHLYAADDGTQDLYPFSQTDDSVTLVKRLLISQINTAPANYVCNNIRYDSTEAVLLIDVKDCGTSGLAQEGIWAVNSSTAQAVRVAAMSFNGMTFDCGADLLCGTSDGSFRSSRDFTIDTSTEAGTFVAAALAW